MDLEQTAVAPGFLQSEWDAAVPWDAYLHSVAKKRDVWDAAARRAQVSEGAKARLQALPGARRILVLTEDWCGDAARSLPPLAAAFDSTDLVEARYLNSDAHPETLGRFLTHGGRAIPTVIVQDEHGNHLGTWGPRPAPLQALMRERLREHGPATADNVATWYAPIMGWYGKDQGKTTIDEVLMVLERGGTPR